LPSECRSPHTCLVCRSFAELRRRLVSKVHAEARHEAVRTSTEDTDRCYIEAVLQALVLNVLLALATLSGDPHELRDTLVLRCRTAVWTGEFVVRAFVVDVPMQLLIARHVVNRGASLHLPFSFARCLRVTPSARMEVPAVLRLPRTVPAVLPARPGPSRTVRLCTRHSLAGIKGWKLSDGADVTLVKLLAPALQGFMHYVIADAGLDEDTRQSLLQSLGGWPPLLIRQSIRHCLFATEQLWRAPRSTTKDMVCSGLWRGLPIPLSATDVSSNLVLSVTRSGNLDEIISHQQEKGGKSLDTYRARVVDASGNYEMWLSVGGGAEVCAPTLAPLPAPTPKTDIRSETE
jgi:hypothetical protein